VPSLALATGAGAGKGLEDLVAQMHAEDELNLRKRAQDEVIRRDQAQESYQNRSLDESTKLRQATQDATNQYRQDTLNAGMRDDIRAREQLRLPGTEVSPGEYDEATKIGKLPMSSYPQQEIGGHLGNGLPTDDQGPTVHDGYVFKGLRSANAAADPSLQEKTYTVDGKPVDANYNPKTGRVTTHDGTDITDKVNHYEKPPAPDRVLVPVNGPGGIPVLTPRSEAAGKQAPLTASTRTMAEGASMLAPHIQSLKDQATVLDQRGLFGPVMSRIRHLGETAGTLDEFFARISDDPELKNDPVVGKFATSLGLMATGAGRVHGGARGGGSPQMLQHFQHLLSDSSSLGMFLGRLDAVDDYMEGYASPAGSGPAKPGGGGGAAPAAAPAGDAYDEYMRRFNNAGAK
jgi:hypothetical protein